MNLHAKHTRETDLEPGQSPRAGSEKFTHTSGSRPLDGYTIKRGVGRGGFGEVYYATSDGGKEVALKLVRRNLDIELRGAKQCLNLKHPNLLGLFDIRKDDTDHSWIVMEYVSGISLEQAIDEQESGLPIDGVLAWFHGMAAGIAYLHDHGIVHRDLKPGNIFSDEGLVKVGDYGLSKFISVSRRSGQTESVGTVHYMAPEVGKGRYGKEIDIYALGIMLYEMLTGHVPFDGESVGEILIKHLTAEPDLSKLQEPYRTAVARALNKDPEKRIRTIAEFLELLPEPAKGHYIQMPHSAPASFDPYHKWLGISREDQPPNHYRLLGIRLFENDPDPIEHAADQRMAHLRTLQAGEHAQLVQKLLNKVSSAKICLLNKVRREEYNRTLQEQFRRPEPKVAPPLPPGLYEPGPTAIDQPKHIYDAAQAEASDELAYEEETNEDTDEPIHKLIRDAGLQIKAYWNDPRWNPIAKLGVLILGTMVLVGTVTLWVPAVAFLGLVYIGYRIVRGMFLWGQAPEPEQSEEMNLEPDQKNYAHAVRRRDWHNNPGPIALPLKTAREKLSDLTGSMLLSAAVSVASSLLIVVFLLRYNSVQPNQYAWLALMTMLGSWAVLIPAKIWEGREGETNLRRFTMLVLGFGVGSIAWALSKGLLVEWTSSMQYQPMAKWPNFLEGNVPLLPAYLSYFGLMFLVLRWWLQANPQRKSRFSLLTMAFTAIVASVLYAFTPFPQPWGILLAANMSVAIQLASPVMESDLSEDDF